MSITRKQAEDLRDLVGTIAHAEREQFKSFCSMREANAAEITLKRAYNQFYEFVLEITEETTL